MSASASTREEALRKAEQHDNAAYLAFSDVLTPSDPVLAKKLWQRRDEYYALAKILPTRGPAHAE